MAEIRKHRRKANLIGDQVRAAMGDAVPRPVVPGTHKVPAAPEASGDDATTSTGGRTRIDFDAGAEHELVDPFFVEVPTEEPVAPKPDAASEQAGGYTLRAADRGGLISLGADDINAISVVFREVDRDEDDDTD